MEHRSRPDPRAPRGRMVKIVETRVLDFVSVQVRDLETSTRFYTEVLSFRVAETRPDAIVFENATGAIFAIRKPMVDLEASRPGWGVGLWFAVPDIGALHENATVHAARVLSPPMDGPFGRMFVVADPDGYALTIHQSA